MAINATRSVRKTDEYLKLVQATNDVVAPGTYEANKKTGAIVLAEGEALAPFMSMQDRELNPLPWSKCTPGPGAYSGEPGRLPGAGLSQMPFKSKMKRFAASTPGSTIFTESTIAKNPGPGTYHPKHLPRGPVADAQLEVQPPVKPILQDIAKTTPSVPPMRYLPRQVPQTEAATADIEKLSSRHTGERGDIAGPGEYEIASDLIKDSPVTIFRKPPGSGRTFRKLWEASAAIESTMPDKALPGPGTYETPLVKHSEAKGATSRFNSKVPKMPDPKENAKTPGPGAYDVLGHIEKASTETQERCEAIALSLGFGSLTERVGWSREVEHPYADSYNVTHVPGPGHYGDSVKESADRDKVIPEKRKKLYGVHHPTLVLALQETEGPLQAFNTSDDRPCNKDLEQWTPAPWQYMPESARGSSINSDLKERAKVGRRGVFGTCADRFYRSPLNAKEGPENDWDGGKANMSKDPTSPEARSSFKSTSPRMRNAGAKEVEIVTLGDIRTPAPGDYEIKEPSYRSPYRIPRSEHLSFGSGKTRFTEKQEVFADFQPFDGPAPGDYNTHASKRHVQGAARLKDKRKPMLVGSTNSEVGPGSYCDNIETMLLKKTFNVTTQGRSLIAQKALPAPE